MLKRSRQFNKSIAKSGGRQSRAQPLELCRGMLRIFVVGHQYFLSDKFNYAHFSQSVSSACSWSGLYLNNLSTFATFMKPLYKINTFSNVAGNYFLRTRIKIVRSFINMMMIKKLQISKRVKIFNFLLNFTTITNNIYCTHNFR